jgi:glycosyltransferase involved in cell wall biosynthesis
MSLVSIVVPTYKRVQYLARCIDSVVAQTYSNWELIIVDGQSGDGTAELVEFYRPRLRDRLVFIEQENQGCCIARNVGIDAARGEYVAFLDSDDEFLPTKLQRQMELFESRPDLGLVYCDYAYIDLEGRRHDSAFDEVWTEARRMKCESVTAGQFVCPQNLLEHLIRQYFIATIVGVVRRDVLADDIRFLPNDLYGCEWLFYLEIARRTRAGFVDEPLCLHHWVGGSLSRTSPARNLIYHRRLLHTILRRFPDMSREARATVKCQLRDTSRQLGLMSFKQAEYAAAVDYFAEALGGGFDRGTALHFLQAVGRWALAFGRPGREPMLRRDYLVEQAG